MTAMIASFVTQRSSPDILPLRNSARLREATSTLYAPGLERLRPFLLVARGRQATSLNPYMEPLIALSWPATRWIRAYGLAVVLVATALAVGLIAETQGINNLGFPLFMMAVAATVWYAGAGPGAAAIVLSILCFDY